MQPVPPHRSAGRRAALWLVAGLAVLVTGALVALVVAGPLAPPTPEASGRAEPTAGVAAPSTGPQEAGRTAVRPEDFGAVGDGAADDTDALQAALDALQEGQELVLAAGRTYRHDDVLQVRRPGAHLRGPGSLLASDEERSSLQVLADRVQVRDLTLEIVPTSRRWTGYDQHRLVLGVVQDVVVHDVRVRGSAGAGVYVDGTTRFRLDDLDVRDTRADGVHMTGGSTDGLVRRPRVERSGDDAVAVVSYVADRGVTARIRVEDVTVRGTSGGRGITVVGGQDVVYQGADIRDTSAAGVYVASEGAPFFTRSVDRVQVRDVSIQRANHTAEVDHGAVLVFNGHPGQHVRDVLVQDVQVRDTRRGAARQVGVVQDPGTEVQGVRLLDVDVDGGGRLLDVPDDVELSGWTVDGVDRDDPRAQPSS